MIPAPPIPARKWVMLPSGWIRAGGLAAFRWEKDGGGSANTTALMLLIVIAHHADVDTGIARLTYDQLEAITDKSRLKIAEGLAVLKRQKLIDESIIGRSLLKLTGYNRERGWAALPARPLYDPSGCVALFKNFSLRSKNELNALKVYLLLAAMRTSETNAANIGFDKIASYTGIDRAQVRTAKSHLINHGLLHVDPVRSDKYDGAMSFAYRLFGLFPRRHAGSTGRSDIS